MGSPPDSTPLSIYLGSKSVKNIADGWNHTHEFGINYVLLPDGTLKILNMYQPLHHDWTLAEVIELNEEGYIDGNPEHIVIGVPQGLGAGGREIVQWVGFLSDLLALSGYGHGIIKRLWYYYKLRPTRKIAKNWISHGLLYPEQLREFIDKKPEWKIEEVCKRLKINREYGYRLLMALGFEPKDDGWRLTQSKSSISRRKAWDRNEKKYKRLREKQLEEA